jgi:hypothetical protein
MEDIRSYNIDFDDTLREREELPAEREAAAEDEVPFEIPRD